MVVGRIAAISGDIFHVRLALEIEEGSRRNAEQILVSCGMLYGPGRRESFTEKVDEGGAIVGDTKGDLGDMALEAGILGAIEEGVAGGPGTIKLMAAGTLAILLFDLKYLVVVDGQGRNIPWLLHLPWTHI